VLNNPVGMVDPDGKAPNEIIDPTGKKVSITRRSDGVLSFSSNAYTNYHKSCQRYE